MASRGWGDDPTTPPDLQLIWTAQFYELQNPQNLWISESKFRGFPRLQLKNDFRGNCNFP